MYNSARIPKNNIYITNIIAQSKIPPQSGAVTHHQDQSITLVNFKIRKIINNVPNNPIIFCYLIFNNYNIIFEKVYEKTDNFLKIICFSYFMFNILIILDNL